MPPSGDVESPLGPGSPSSHELSRRDGAGRTQSPVGTNTLSKPGMWRRDPIAEHEAEIKEFDILGFAR